MERESLPVAESSSSRREWSEVQVSPELTNLPRMLSADEQRYLIWLTQAKYEGWGAVVDLGCWLGSSSACLAEGFVRSGKAGFVHSFDLFRWVRGYMEKDSDLRLPDDADFMPEFERLTAPWRDRVRAQKVDLFGYQWTGGPVEILFVDAAKSWGLTNAIFRGFASAVVPGRTRVVFQDFRYPETHWLPLILGSRPDLWEELENTSDGTTSTWLAKKPLAGPGGVDTDYGPGSFDFATAARIYAERERVDPAGHAHYVQSMVRQALIYGDDSDVAAARARVEALSGSRYVRYSVEVLEGVESDMVPLAWKAMAAKDYEGAVAIARRCLRARCPVPYALSPLGLGLAKMGRYEEAEQSLREMRRLLPHRHEPLLSLADVVSERKRCQEALDLLLEALRLLPEHSEDANYAFAVLERISWQPGFAEAALQVANTARPWILSMPTVRERIDRVVRQMGGPRKA